MGKIKYAVIGSGWRAEFYIRIAKAVPDKFDLTGVLVRDKAKGEEFSKIHDVKVVNTLDELLKDNPEFVVLSVKRGILSGYMIELFEKKVPVLSETPPAESVEELIKLWEAYEKYSPKVQVAEQYFLQPIYASWHNAITKGLLGEVSNMSISSLHGYHGMSMIRFLMGVGYENCSISGKRFKFPVTETYGREGMSFDGEIFNCPREKVTLEFESGKVAFFDFADPAQYHSFIRTRQLNVQGVRGEIDDLTIRYLTKENIPVTAELNRIDLGVYGNQEWSHFAIMMGEEFLYKSPFLNARLNDDEIAVGSILLGFKEYLETGKDCYSLRSACQDMYLTLKMNEAMENPYTVVKTEDMPWK